VAAAQQFTHPGGVLGQGQAEFQHRFHDDALQQRPPDPAGRVLAPVRERPFPNRQVVQDDITLDLVLEHAAVQLFLEKGEYYLLPKRCFERPNEVDGLRDLLQTEFAHRSKS